MTFRRREGFTLIETAFVAAVVGVIAAAVGPAMHRARVSASGAASASNLMQIGQGAGMYAHDNEGRIFSKLMFDGSVNAWASGDAMPSWNPRNGKQEWRQTYVPLDTFPVPLGGLGDETLLSQRYRWTLGGLQGVDYLRPLMGSNRP